MHDVTDDLVTVHEQQITQGHGSHQSSLRIQHIADIDGLTVEAYLTDPLDGLIHRQILLQVYIFDRHDTSGGIFRIAQQMIDISAHIGACVGQKLFDNVGRHLLQQIGRIVRHQVVDDVRCFLIRQGRDDLLLIVHI